MSDTGNIILTSSCAHLHSALADKFPRMQIRNLGFNSHIGMMNGPVWCFVDWLLPDVSGLELCRRLREDTGTAQSHITLVLDEDDSEAKRRALRAGADDYCIGPITVDLIIDRIKHFQSEDENPALASSFVHGDLAVNLTAQSARWRGKPIILRPNEFRLLSHFVENPDRVFSRNSLISKLGKNSETVDERTVDVWVGRLRRTLKNHGAPDPLRTVRTMGYVMDSASS